MRNSKLGTIDALLVGSIIISLSGTCVAPGRVAFSIPEAVPKRIGGLVALVSSRTAMAAPISIFVPSLEISNVCGRFAPTNRAVGIIKSFFSVCKVAPRSKGLFFNSGRVIVAGTATSAVCFRLPRSTITKDGVQLVDPVRNRIVMSNGCVRGKGVLYSFSPCSN